MAPRPAPYAGHCSRRPHAGEGDEYGLTDPPNPDEILAVPLQPGDALVFHCELFHYTPPNRTSRRRRAVQYHYMAADVEKTENQFSFEPELYFE